MNLGQIQHVEHHTGKKTKQVKTNTTGGLSKGKHTKRMQEKHNTIQKKFVLCCTIQMRRFW